MALSVKPVRVFKMRVGKSEVARLFVHLLRKGIHASRKGDRNGNRGIVCGLQKERVEKLNAADANIFTTEKNLKEYGDKIPADKKATIETALGKLKEAHKNSDVTAIDAALAELNNAWQAASQDIYAAQQAQQQAGAQANAGAGAGAASDAKAQPEDVEFEEVK